MVSINMKPTIKDIRSTYTENRAETDKIGGGPWLYYVMRPLSFYPTWLFLRLGISANQTSVLSIMFMLAGCVFLILNTYTSNIVGGILLNIYHLLDSVDGNVARYTGQVGSRFGRFIEPFGSILDRALILPCVGIGAFHNPGFFPVAIDSWVFILVGVFTAILNLANPYISAILKGKPWPYILDFPSRTSERGLYYLALRTIGGYYLILLLIFSIFNLLGIYLLIQLGFAIGNLLLRNIRF